MGVAREYCRRELGSCHGCKYDDDDLLRAHAGSKVHAYATRPCMAGISGWGKDLMRTIVSEVLAAKIVSP